jgi:hypothetical protein
MAYDPDRHHISLSPRSEANPANWRGFMVAGGYRKDPQALPGAAEYGSTFDVLESNGYSRWSQDDFSGGAYQYVWGKDPAMFRSCRMMRPVTYERSIATIPEMELAGRQENVVPNWYPTAHVGGTPQTALVRPPLLTYARHGKVCSVYAYGKNVTFGVLQGRFVHIDADDGTGMGNVLHSGPAEAAAFDRGDEVLYLGNESDRKLYRYNPEGGAKTPATYDYPNGVTGRRLIHINADGPRITCIFARMIADLTVPDDTTTAVGAASKYWAVNRKYRLPGTVIDSIWYNNVLYLLVCDGTYDADTLENMGGWKTQILSWNGADLLPVVDFPFTFRGRCIAEYAGRIFVGGRGVDFNDEDAIYGELYEVQASSIRSIRSFAPEHRVVSAVPRTATKSIDQLVVWEGLLWYFNAEMSCLEAYDVTTDAFFCGPEYAVDEVNDTMGRILAVNEGLIVTSYGPATGSYNGTTETGTHVSDFVVHRLAASGAQTSWPEVITSDFTPEPAYDKRWNEFTVMTKYGPTTEVYYSTDGGDNWSEIFEVAGSLEVNGDWQFTTFDASGIPAAKRVAFKIVLGRTSASGYTELIGFTGQFTYVGTGKRIWQMTIAGVEVAESLLGEDQEVQNVWDLHDDLFGWYDSGEKLRFFDVDGSEHTVRIIDISESQPIVGRADVGGGEKPEALWNVSLLEQ